MNYIILFPDSLTVQHRVITYITSGCVSQGLLGGAKGGAPECKDGAHDSQTAGAGAASRRGGGARRLREGCKGWAPAWSRGAAATLGTQPAVTWGQHEGKHLRLQPHRLPQQLAVSLIAICNNYVLFKIGSGWNTSAVQLL